MPKKQKRSKTRDMTPVPLPPAPESLGRIILMNGRTRTRQAIDLWQAQAWIRWAAGIAVSIGVLVTGVVKTKAYLDYWYTPTTVTEEVKRSVQGVKEDVVSTNQALEREVKRLEKELDRLERSVRISEWRRER